MTALHEWRVERPGPNLPQPDTVQVKADTVAVEQGALIFTRVGEPAHSVAIFAAGEWTRAEAVEPTPRHGAGR
jgi:hypothetical protein